LDSWPQRISRKKGVLLRARAGRLCTLPAESLGPGSNLSFLSAELSE
jgi:hypothetical protein